MSAPVIAVLALLAVVAVVLLWKVVLTAAAIGGLQWVVVAHVDHAVVQVLAYAVPALVVAFVLTRLFSVRSAVSAHGRVRKEVH